ncbi:putative antitoxin YezG [Paenibacillus sp. L3-i20]|nr:putative antitoxin YezG [Paenibacillus sp. L3-i20]
MDSTLVYFDFNTHDEGKYNYYLDIPSIYNVDQSVFDEKMRGINKLLENLNDEFRNHNTHVWTNLTLMLTSEGEFNISYDYEDVLASDITNTERRWLFKYKHLGILPQSEKSKKFIEDYLKKHS